MQAEVAGHYGGVVNGLMDGQVMVKRCDSEAEDLSGAQEEVEEGLQQAAGGADSFFFVTREVSSCFGMTVVVYQIFRKDKLQKKKYIGICSPGSAQTMATMSPVPARVNM